MDFHFTDWLWIKLIGGALIIGIVSFIYALVTGKTIEEARRERRAQEANSRTPK